MFGSARGLASNHRPGGWQRTKYVLAHPLHPTNSVLIIETSPPLENETAVIRYDYGDPSLGTCQETIQGGNHFRYWVQNGPQRNSGAVFMAASAEHSLQRTFCFLTRLFCFSVGFSIDEVLHLIFISESPCYSQWV